MDGENIIIQVTWWFLLLQDYLFQVLHRAGAYQGNADAFLQEVCRVVPPPISGRLRDEGDTVAVLNLRKNTIPLRVIMTLLTRLLNPTGRLVEEHMAVGRGRPRHRNRQAANQSSIHNSP